MLGARFGPRAIRAASGRHMKTRAFNPVTGQNPYTSWAKVLDCGDIPVTPLDGAVAVRQMTEGLTELMHRKAASNHLDHLRLVLLGGDHLIALPMLRALREVHGEPVTLIHFDSHLDTLDPSVYPQTWTSETTEVNHGTVFWHAAQEGLLTGWPNGTNVHVGVNTRLSGSDWNDLVSDTRSGFVQIRADELDDAGVKGVVRRVRDALALHRPPHQSKKTKIYLSIDIDVLDPAFAPGTGAPEPGGWTSRELLAVLRGILDLDLDLEIVGADVVEVAPAYDTPGGDTAFVAAGLVYEIISFMVKRDDPTFTASVSTVVSGLALDKEL